MTLAKSLPTSPEALLGQAAELTFGPVLGGLPPHTLAKIQAVLQAFPQIRWIKLYGSRAMGRHRSGSDIDLCLEAPTMDLRQLLLLAAELDDLLLPWPIDLQIRHRIDHKGLENHISRAGTVLWERNQP